jgi:hypothetical protein
MDDHDTKIARAAALEMRGDILIGIDDLIDNWFNYDLPIHLRWKIHATILALPLPGNAP